MNHGDKNGTRQRAPTRQRFNLPLLVIFLNENMRGIVVRVRAWGHDVAVAVVVDHVAVGEAHSQCERSIMLQNAKIMDIIIH